MGNNNKVEIVDDKLEALQRALGMLSTAKEFTLTVFNGDEINATILCNKWREVDVIKKSIATQSYMLEDLTSESLTNKY